MSESVFLFHRFICPSVYICVSVYVVYVLCVCECDSCVVGMCVAGMFLCGCAGLLHVGLIAGFGEGSTQDYGSCWSVSQDDLLLILVWP